MRVPSKFFTSLLKNIQFQPWKLEGAQQLTLISVKKYWIGSYLKICLSGVGEFVFHTAKYDHRFYNSEWNHYIVTWD